MNYIKELNMFYRIIDTEHLPANAILLWYTLMAIANSLHWTSEFSISLSLLECKTKLNKSTICRMRQVLSERKFIRFRTVGGKACAVYSLCPLELQLALRDATQNEQATDLELQLESHGETLSATQNQSIPLISIKTKLNNKENNKRKSAVADESAPMLTTPQKKKEKSSGQKERKRGVLFDPNRWLETVDSAWRDAMHQWLEYKSARKQTYKTELGAQKCLAMLKDLAHNNPRTAQSIVDQSIANNWAGLFALRDSGTTRGQPDTNRPQYGQRIGQIMQPEDEAKRQLIIERLRNAGKNRN